MNISSNKITHSSVENFANLNDHQEYYLPIYGMELKFLYILQTF